MFALEVETAACSVWAAHITALRQSFHLNRDAVVDPTFEVGPAHGFTTDDQVFNGGCALDGDDVFCAAADASACVIYRGADDTIDEMQPHEEDVDIAFGGAVRVDPDLVVLVPYNSAYVGRCNPLTGAHIRGASTLQVDPEYQGGCLAMKGGRRVVVMAPKLAPNIGLYYPDDDEFELGPTLGTCNSAFLLPDGKVAFARAGSSHQFVIYDLDADTLTFNGINTGNVWGGLLLPSANLLFAPWNTTRAFAWTTAAVAAFNSNVLSGLNKVIGAAFAPNGDVIFSPFALATIPYFRPSNNTLYAGLSFTNSTSEAFSGPVTLKSGKTIFIPRKSATFGIYTHIPEPVVDLPATALCSPYYAQAA